MEIICGDIHLDLSTVKGEKVIKLVKPFEEQLSVIGVAENEGCALLDGQTLSVFVDLDKVVVTSKSNFEAIAKSPTTPDTFIQLKDFVNA